MKFIHRLKEKAIRFARNEEAASAIEYAIVAGVVVVVLLAGITVFYESLSAAFSSIADLIPGATGDGGGEGGGDGG